MQLFAATFEKCLLTLEDTLNIQDERKAQDIWESKTHELKGSAYNLGFNELGDRAGHAEKLKGKDKGKDKFVKILKVIYLEVDKMLSGM